MTVWLTITVWLLIRLRSEHNEIVGVFQSEQLALEWIELRNGVRSDFSLRPYKMNAELKEELGVCQGCGCLDD